jgi:hypothetical protein
VLGAWLADREVEDPNPNQRRRAVAVDVLHCDDASVSQVTMVDRRQSRPSRGRGRSARFLIGGSFVRSHLPHLREPGMAGLGATPGAVQCVVQEDKQHADHLVALRGVEVMRIGEQPEAANEVGRGAGVGDVDRVAQRNPVAGCDGDVEQRAAGLARSKSMNAAARGWTIPARDAGGASAILCAWSTCPECRDRRWTG